jgi:hypothetical protein
MEKTIEVIQITISQGPILNWLEKRVISENNLIIAEQLHRRSFLIGTGPIPDNTPALVIEVIEALANLDWPFTPGNPRP